MARPKSDRWHKKPTALLGGGAIFTVVAAVNLALVPLTPQARVVLCAGAFLFLIGLIDDFFNLKPYQKLSGQIMGAAAVVWCGLTLPWTGSPPVNMAITLFWLIGITNAVNLLDNMDGLAAGIAAIASTFLALTFLGNAQAAEALMLAVFGAGLLGFLVYNSNPASIFMGDCGSMFIGFFLAGSALLNPTGGRSRSLLPVLAVPVLILFIPIFDTLMVTILRKLAGRSVARGGRDHTSHRLVALGLSERRAVWMLYALAAVSGFLGLLVCDLALDYSLAAVLGYVLLLTFVGVHLGSVKVYDEAEVRTARAKPLVAFLVDLSYKRRVFEVLLDVVLITLSYYLAYAAVFGHLTDDEPLRRFLLAVPVLVSVKLLTFLGMGVYRGLWRYVSIDDVIVFAKAVVAASVDPGGKFAVVVISQGLQHFAIICLLGDWLDTFQDHIKPCDIGIMFNPNFFACLGVFHLALEHVFLAQRHCDCRGAEFAVECHLLDQSLDGVADSPAAGKAGRVAAGAGWPGRTQILRFRRWAWICHLGPLSGARTGQRTGNVHMVNKV